MEESNQLRPPNNRPLKNVSCPYCGIDLERNNTIKEHVVGRHFVPSGKFVRSWNLILRACKHCNEIKSDLEDDISAISLLLPNAMIGEDESFANEVIRKATNSFSRRTKKSVVDSSETTVYKGSLMPNVSFSATMVAPPQIERSRAFELAWYQLVGFFYLLTYNSTERKGGCWPGGCLPIGVVHQADWGNAVQLWFMKSVEAWHQRIMGIMAEGFYKIAVRRHPKAEVWSWALEWNKTIRVIGFVGEEEAIREIVQTMPVMPMHVMSGQGGNYLRIRVEVPLEESSDTLFSHTAIVENR